MQSIMKERALAKVDKEILLDARNKAMKLQLDEEFINLLNRELYLREKKTN
ncbi:sporulation histidine kinase inhibitor Sda [Halalkalibacter flavus]|jgi:hypothetical protein|uniref:sporulation histidine kinase inhibitor Sda n=1 Tax=Halalkalibacter flavus TaxID=3090668 RepID=UPI002FC6CF91